MDAESWPPCRPNSTGELIGILFCLRKRGYEMVYVQGTCFSDGGVSFISYAAPMVIWGPSSQNANTATCITFN